MNINKKTNIQKITEIFLKEYFRINGEYSIADDGIIDVDGNAILNINRFNQLNLTELPIQFGYVTGFFEFERTNIESLKGFPHTVDDYCSIEQSEKLISLEFSPKTGRIYTQNCNKLKSLDFLNSNMFRGNDLQLECFGTNFSATNFKFNHFPTPTADEMRRFIQLNPEFNTEQQAPWIQLIKDYYDHKDLFRAIGEFEILYNEPWIKPEDKIEIIQSNEELYF